MKRILLILLVVIVYFLFSYLAAAIISHTVYVFELKDLVVPLVLGLVVEYMDIVKLAKLLRGKGDK